MSKAPPVQALEPCPNPWCRSHQPERYNVRGVESCRSLDGWIAECGDCGLKAEWKQTQAEAIAAWNTRPRPATHDAWIEAAARAMCDAAWQAVGEDWSVASDEQRDEFRLMARAVAAVTLHEGGEGLARRIAQFVRGWNGETRDGDTFLIADEIEEQFASLTPPASKPVSDDGRGELVANAAGYLAAIDDPVRVMDGPGSPFLQYNGRHVINAFKAGALSTPANAEVVEVLRAARAGLSAMMDAWFDYHDAHSLTQPVTGAAGGAFDKALAARERIDRILGDET